MNRIARKLRIVLFRLPVQMVVALVTLVILTALAIGLPAIYLIRQQLDRQAWVLVEQGIKVGDSALRTRQANLSNLATLTAQRPTLLSLLQTGDEAQLRAYLQTLRESVNLGAVLLCRPDGAVFLQVEAAGGVPVAGEVCQPGRIEPVFRDPGSGAGWLLARGEVTGAPGGQSVVVAQALDSRVAQDLGEQTGMDHLLLLDGEPVISTFADVAQVWQVVGSRLASPRQDQTLAFSLQDRPYYAALVHSDSGIDLLTALPVDNIEQTQRSLTLGLGGGMLLVILVSSALGIYLARRISEPLERLKRSAKNLRMGDLATPVNTQTKVREISQVAFALEDARVALQHSLEELRREKAWTDHLLEAVVEGIVTLDRAGRITFFSQGAERITGWNQERLLGRKLDDVFRLPEGGLFSQSIPAPGGKQALTPVLLDGRQATLAITAARLASPQTGRAVAILVFRDVSDEEAMHRLLGDFMANITHEFRTPLTALAASIELLLDQLPSLSQAELKELLDSLHLGILSLQTLIDNLLEGASIEAGRFRVQPRPADLDELLRETAHTMQPLLEKYGLRLRLDLPETLPPVVIDPRRTAQVLVNLISNAVKWSPAGSDVCLAVAPIAGEARLRVSVTDAGPGVPAEQRRDLFNRFARPEGQDRPAQVGAGIGLSVVKAIVEAQGGQVGVADRPEGGGAVFWFTVVEETPRSPAARPSPIREETPGERGDDIVPEKGDV